MSDSLYWKDKGGYFRTYISNGFYSENEFMSRPMEDEKVPAYSEIKHLLPQPVWDDHDDALRCYGRAWEIAFGNLKKPAAGSGFLSNFIDPAFNGNVFMWDSVFMLMYGIYGHRAFPFQKTLNNFYAKQHRDGFICREIDATTGEEQFHRYDPSSTGPNLLAWSEWSYYCFSEDVNRLKEVFPVIAGYHRWMRNFRIWQDGTYYASGWGCGMDNQPRIRDNYPFEFFHGFMSWIDTTLQQILSARLLVKMAKVIHREGDAEEFRKEADKLCVLVNDKMWNEEKQFYFDKYADQSLSHVITIGSYWALLADIVPKERLAGFLAHLDNPEEFNRPHRVPSLPASDPGYEPAGDYWCGSIWAPTNYMVLKGLESSGAFALAADIADNHYNNILHTFTTDGTFYENYAPEYPGKGSLAANEFVGWTGISAINVLLEFILGVRADVPGRTVHWNIRQLERHGVLNYPLGILGSVDMVCHKRKNAGEEPILDIRSTTAFTLVVRWGNKERSIPVQPSSEILR